MEDFNQPVIDEFRANNGRVGGWLEGARLLLLTTTGARSGARRTVPLGYLPDGGERVLVIGSAGGSPRHPAWFHNVLANPRVTVEDGVFTYDADAVVLAGVERDQAFARAVEADAGWGAYQDKAARVLPVVALVPVTGGPPTASSPGAALMLVHDAFRRELALIRAEVAASGGGIGAQLRVNCLTLCAGLHNHHTGEDVGLFPFLAGRHPELVPTIDRLRSEHEAIAALVVQLQQVLAGAAADVRTQVERLTAEVERHLAYRRRN